MNTLTKNHSDILAFNDIVVKRMTDSEAYEIECKPLPEAVEHFITKFGQARWDEIRGDFGVIKEG